MASRAVLGEFPQIGFEEVAPIFPFPHAIMPHSGVPLALIREAMKRRRQWLEDEVYEGKRVGEEPEYLSQALTALATWGEE